MKFLAVFYAFVLVAMLSCQCFGTEPGTRHPDATVDDFKPGSAGYYPVTDKVSGMVRVRSNPIPLMVGQPEPLIVADTLTAGQIADRQFVNSGNRWSDARSAWIDSAAWVRATGTQQRSRTSYQSSSKIKTSKTFNSK